MKYYEFFSAHDPKAEEIYPFPLPLSMLFTYDMRVRWNPFLKYQMNRVIVK